MKITIEEEKENIIGYIEKLTDYKPDSKNIKEILLNERKDFEIKFDKKLYTYVVKTPIYRNPFCNIGLMSEMTINKNIIKSTRMPQAESFSPGDDISKILKKPEDKIGYDELFREYNGVRIMEPDNVVIGKENIEKRYFF